MKKLSILLIIYLTAITCSATEYSEFAAKEYASKCNKEKVHITVKKEHIEEFAQEIGNKFIPYIAYGYGDMKAKKCKKQRVSYICLLDCNLNPIWSCVVSSK